jgi:hypothetical protein
MVSVSSNLPKFNDLNREMARMILDVQKTNHLKEVISLSDKVEKVCEQAQKISAKKIKEATLEVFQKHSEMVFFDQGENFYRLTQQKENDGIRRDLSLMREIQKISSQAEDLQVQFAILSPEQLVEEIHKLSTSLQAIAQKDSYNEELLENVTQKALQKIRHLQFRLDFPIVEELCEFSYQNNFARKLHQIAEDLNMGKRESFAELPSFHQEEIEQRGTKEKPLFERCQLRLKHLQSLCHLAEEFLYGEANERIDRFQNLDGQTKKSIDGYLFSFCGTLFEELKEDLQRGSEEACVLCTKAIMAYVSHQVMGE